MHTVYKAVNLINGKAYIGYTSNFKNRRAKHEWHSDNNPVTHFHRAIRRYGKDSFEWEILYESLDKEHTWLTMEEHFIRSHNTHAEDGHGYNYSYGGYGQGKVVTRDARNNMRSAQLGKKQSPETVKKRTLKIIGQKRSVEHREFISKLNSGRKHTDISKQNMSDAHKKRIEINGITYVGLADAAKRLNISKAILMRRMKSGKIEYKRITQ